jgi:glycerol-3-phosphate dehydrogenase
VHAGLLPALPFQADGQVRLENHPRIIDHSRSGAPGLITVIGVKYTTARRVAVEAVDRVYRMWGSRPAPSISAGRSLPGGKIRHLATFLQEEARKGLCNLGAAEIHSLITNYGSAYPEVLRFLPDMEGNKDGIKTALLQAQVLAAVRTEMALKLDDVLLRRTDLGSAGKPGREDLELCAQIMGQELGWTHARRQAEIEEIEKVYHYV